MMKTFKTFFQRRSTDRLFSRLDGQLTDFVKRYTNDADLSTNQTAAQQGQALGSANELVEVQTKLDKVRQHPTSDLFQTVDQLKNLNLNVQNLNDRCFYAVHQFQIEPMTVSCLTDYVSKLKGSLKNIRIDFLNRRK